MDDPRRIEPVQQTKIFWSGGQHDLF